MQLIDPGRGVGDFDLDPELVDRFAGSIERLIGPEAPLGLAVSGGPDSLALLLLGHAARPGRVRVATVDHGLRSGSADEAAAVASLCAAMGVAHDTLIVEWREPPQANLQARARAQRFRMLGDWGRTRDLCAIATAHHADDQAETMLMRLARGAGLSGLAAIRRDRMLATGVRLIRPLLGWRRETLHRLVARAGLTPIDDPTNRDPAHDRTRIREAIAASGLGDVRQIANSAASLADAEEAIEWMVDGLAQLRLERTGEGGFALDPEGLPFEIRRRLLLRIFAASERPPPRGPELVRLIRALVAGRVATLGGLRFAPGEKWQVVPAPPHAAPRPEE